MGEHPASAVVDDFQRADHADGVPRVARRVGERHPVQGERGGVVEAQHIRPDPLLQPAAGQFVAIEAAPVGSGGGAWDVDDHDVVGVLGRKCGHVGLRQHVVWRGADGVEWMTG